METLPEGKRDLVSSSSHALFALYRTNFGLRSAIRTNWDLTRPLRTDLVALGPPSKSYADILL